MNVNTTIENRAKGKVVVAKGANNGKSKQTTIPFDPSRTNAQNHGDAAGALLRMLVPANRRGFVAATAKHKVFAETKHRFTYSI